MFWVIALTLVAMGIGLDVVRDKRMGRDLRTIMYLLVCFLLILIIFLIVPGVWRGKPITSLEDGMIYFVHFQYSDWESSSSKVPVLLQLGTKNDGKFLYYQIPRHKLLNETGEPFNADNLIYPAFKVSHVQRAKIIEKQDFNQTTRKFMVYKLTPVTVSMLKK